jgi:hypothetical protein
LHFCRRRAECRIHAKRNHEGVFLLHLFTNT